VVVLTFDGDALDRFWLAGYVPELVAAERQRYQPISWIAGHLGRTWTVDSVCTDGFTEAFYARPEQFLLDGVRRAQSAWGFVDHAVATRAVEKLRSDLEDGTWDRTNGHLRRQPTFDGSLRLLTVYPT